MVEAAEVNVAVDAQGGPPSADQKPTTPEEEIKKLKTQQEKNMKAIAKLQNPREGAEGEQLAGWQQLFIKMITPKLVSFTKPFLVAVISFVMTLGICAIILWALLTDCRTVQTSKTGAVTSQIKYVVAARKVPGLDICLRETSTFSSSVAGGLLEENLCLPEGSFTSSWPEEVVKGIIASAEDHKYGTKGLPWCDGARDRALTMCDQEAGGSGQCPVCIGSGVTSSTKKAFNTVYDETTCVNAFHAVFWTLCIMSRLELLTTFLIVLVLMATGVMHQYGPTGEKMGFMDSLKNDWANAETLT